MSVECSVMSELVIERATRKAYEGLARWHYRGERPGPFTAIFGARKPGERQWAGVIVYAMPQIGSAMRAKAMAAVTMRKGSGTLFQAGEGSSLSDRIEWLNANVRCISRVVVDPRYRGIGLGVRLVRETLPLAGAPIVEAIAAMGNINPFFERAGMMRFTPPPSAASVGLERAFRLIGAPQRMFIDPRAVHEKLSGLSGETSLFIEAEMRLFLKPFVKRRNMEHSYERTRFVLSRLAGRPVYYLWCKNEKGDE